MGSEVLIRSFSSSSNFTGFMIVIGGLLGLTIGLIASKLLNKVNETLILYIPLLFMPLIIVIISSLVMNLV